MCGIFGYLVARERLDALEPWLDTALASLHHRGPDDQGTARSVGTRFAVGMGQTRLSILDLSPAGHQPFASEDGRHLLVLNGEIYNHRELRAPLEREGLHFRGTSDTETVLHLLIREGLDAVSRFVGMFAFALWDRERDTLLLVRDRLGKKPLYLVQQGDRLVFSSEVRALLATGLAPRQLDRAALLRWLARGSTHEPDGLLPGVRSLPPGCALELGPDGAHERRYWQLPEEAPIDWRERLPELLDDAVRLRLLSDRPLGVFLSGGVDSAAITAVAARHARTSLDAFTLTFDEATHDEGDRAAAIARHIGVRHHAARLTSSEALRDLDEALTSQDLPSHDGFNTWFVTRAARRAGLVVALAGTGGDEVFAGYAHFRRFARYLALGRQARHLPAGLLARLATGLDPRLPTRLRKALGLLGANGRTEATYALLREMFSPAQIASLLGPKGAAEAAASGAPDLPVSPDWRADRPPELALTPLELSGYLIDTQLRDIDVMSMAHGFEVRSPLLDHRLVGLMAGVPAGVRNPRGPVNKRLLVRAAGLPESLFAHPKRGFVLPWDRWLAGPLTAWVDHHLAPERVRATGILDPDGTRRLIASFRRSAALPRSVCEMTQSINGTRLLALVALQSFCTRHGIIGFG